MRTLALALTLTFAPAAARADTDEPALDRSRLLYWTTVTVGMLHLADHVVRNNHSGWPFADEVTPGTLAILAVPAILGAGYVLDGPLYGLISSSVLLGVVTLTHATLETPSHVYRPWTNGSNLLEAESKMAGGIAVGLVAAVSLSLAAQVVSNILDGREHGFTWRRQRGRDRSVPVTVVPAAGGATVSTAWSF